MIYFWHFLTYHRKSPYHGKNIRTISLFFMIWHRNIAWNKPMVITVSWAISFCFLISWETLNLTLSLILWNLWILQCIPRHETILLLQTKMEKRKITILLQNNGDIAGNMRGIFLSGILLTTGWEIPIKHGHLDCGKIIEETGRFSSKPCLTTRG